MQESGNLKITFANQEQAAAVYPEVKELLSDYKYWSEALALEENIIKVEYDIHMYTCDYPGLVLGICKEIVSKDASIEFDVKADCADDEGIYNCIEKGYFKGQVFYFESDTTTIKEPDFDTPNFDEMGEEELADWDPFEDVEEQTETVIIKGKIVDGKLILE